MLSLIMMWKLLGEICSWYDAGGQNGQLKQFFLASRSSFALAEIHSPSSGALCTPKLLQNQKIVRHQTYLSFWVFYLFWNNFISFRILDVQWNWNFKGLSASEHECNSQTNEISDLGILPVFLLPCAWGKTLIKMLSKIKLSFTNKMHNKHCNSS